jgi:predicted glycoside hydrolase/deacetylase ChbG (UPF0249 family)
LVRPPRAEADRSVAFCADDVGLVVGVAETVVALAVGRRLSSASCVTTAAAWPSEGAAAGAATKALNGFELGLHFNLTEGAPLSLDLARVWPQLPGLKELIVRAHLGALPLAALASEFRAQVDAFADVIGRAPAHVDGHQHVHHLPRVRDVLLREIAARDAKTRPAIRNTGHLIGPGHAIKRMVIEGTGGRALLRDLRAKGLRHNQALLGVYDFRGDYRPLVRGWLAAAPQRGGLVFCHPKRGSTSGADPIAAARAREAVYLASDAFTDDLAEAGFSLGSAWQSSSAD